MIKVLKEFGNCFAWDYDETHGLIRELVKLNLPIRPNKKPVKQIPRRFVPEIMSKIKVEIERLLQNKFIRPFKYVEWLVNIVPAIKKMLPLKSA